MGSVTSQGSLHGQFQRAVERADLLQARALARDLGQLYLSDSFALLLLFTDRGLTRFERAAPRWHARLVVPAADLTIAEAQSTLGALALLPGPSRPQAVELLAVACRAHGARLAPASAPPAR